MANNVSGIYAICLDEDQSKFYVGSAKDIQARWLKHQSDFRRGKHPNQHLSRAFIKHGIEAFNLEILAYSEAQDLTSAEQLFLDAFQPYYNMCKVAGSKAGVPQSEETKQKIGAANAIANRGKRRGPLNAEDSAALKIRLKKNDNWLENTRAASALRRGIIPWAAIEASHQVTRDPVKMSLRTASLSTEHATEVCKLWFEGMMPDAIGTIYNVGANIVCAIVSGRTMKHVSRPYNQGYYKERLKQSKATNASTARATMKEMREKAA